MKRWIAPGVIACGFLTPATLPAQGNWTREVRAPTPRTEVAVAVRDGEIFVIGGLTRRGVTRLVEVYHPRKRRWRTSASLPLPVHHPGAGVVGKRLYVVGGFGRGSFWAGADTLYEYLPRPNAWKKRASMPTARGALGVGVIDGKLHAVGGRSQRGDVAAHEVYDPATDTWKRLAPMPTARDHLAAAVLRGRLYAIGGRLGSYARNLGVNEVYNPRTDAWATRRPIPTPRSGIAAAVLDGRISSSAESRWRGPSRTTRATTPTETGGRSSPRCPGRGTAWARRPGEAGSSS